MKKTRAEIKSDLDLAERAVNKCRAEVMRRLDRCDTMIRLHLWRVEDEEETSKEDQEQHALNSRMRDVWAHVAMWLDNRLEEAQETAQKQIEQCKQASHKTNSSRAHRKKKTYR